MLSRLVRGSWRLARAEAGGKTSKGSAASIVDLDDLRRFFASSSSSSRDGQGQDKKKSNSAGSSSSPPSGWHEITIDRTGLVGGGGGGREEERSSTSAEPATTTTTTSPSRSQAASVPVPPPIETPMTRHIKALIQVRRMREFFMAISRLLFFESIRKQTTLTLLSLSFLKKQKTTCFLSSAGDPSRSPSS